MGTLIVSTKDFYRALWNGAQEGFTELTLIRPKPNAEDEVQSWFSKWPGELDEKFLPRLTGAVGQWNVYHGLGIRSRMRGRDEDVLAVTSIAVDIDFKKTPQEQAVKALKEFPLKASAGLLTGGGIHAYWLLKEPVVGDDLRKVKPLVRAMATTLGGDLRACTLKQIMRAPSVNIKYAPAVPTQFVVWRPSLRYGLMEFEDIFPNVYDGMATSGTPAPSATAAVTHASHNHPEPTKEIPVELQNKIAKLMSEIWIIGFRHNLTLYLSGLLAHAGYNRESAVQVVRTICAMSRDEEAGNREVDVGTTYNQFAVDGPVAGAPSMEKLINVEFPLPVQEKAKKIFDLVRKSVPKPPRGPRENGRREIEPDFEIVKIIKFDSRPAIWEVTLKHNSEKVITVKGETKTAIWDYKDFQPACWEQNNIVIAMISQIRWLTMISRIPIETREAPKEARVDGAIEEALGQFVGEKKTNPEVGELKTFAGNDEQSVFFKLSAFKSYLRNDGLKPTERDLCNTLRTVGWEPASKRMGDTIVRVWNRPISANGHKSTEVFKEPAKAANEK